MRGVAWRWTGTGAQAQHHGVWDGGGVFIAALALLAKASSDAIVILPTSACSTHHTAPLLLLRVPLFLHLLRLLTSRASTSPSRSPTDTPPATATSGGLRSEA